MNKQRIVDLILAWVYIGVSGATFAEGKVAGKVLVRLMDDEAGMLSLLSENNAVEKLKEIIDQEVELLKI